MKSQLKFLLASLIGFTLLYCTNNRIAKKEILLADRKAPLGWNSVKIYEDKTFEFTVSGMRERTVYPGTVKISNDTLYFKYSGLVPKVGETAIINKNAIIYIHGTYQEILGITTNKLKQ